MPKAITTPELKLETAMLNIDVDVHGDREWQQMAESLANVNGREQQGNAGGDSEKDDGEPCDDQAEIDVLNMMLIGMNYNDDSIAGATMRVRHESAKPRDTRVYTCTLSANCPWHSTGTHTSNRIKVSVLFFISWVWSWVWVWVWVWSWVWVWVWV